jgi:[ribosomal protein S18]-alanine N-acetyltransferase
MTGESAVGPSVLEIRQLRRDDLDAVMEIETDSFTTPWRRETFVSLLDRADSDLVAAVRDDRLIGYAVCWTVIDQSELGNVAVAPALRGAGIGRRLVAEAVERVRRRRSRELFLEVRASNASARHLYESMGFAVIGRRRAYYRKPIEDALVMRLDLSRGEGHK